MSIRKYKTKNGMRYAAEVFEGGQRIAYRGGFLTKLEALKWESTAKDSVTMPRRLALYEVTALYLQKREGRCKKNTLIYKKSVLRKLNKFIGPKTEFSTITKNDLEAFLEAAKEAAMSAVEVLSERDNIGVIGFDDTAKWVVPFQSVSSVPPPAGELSVT